MANTECLEKQEIEMDESGRSQELLESVEMVTQMRTDVVKLSTTTTSSIKGDEEGEPPPELINAQYINIHRVPDSLSKGLVEVGSPAPQGLISGELMQHHMGHAGIVVDMMVPQANSADFAQHSPLDRTALPQYISEHYDGEDDLLPNDLTDEDRRLAAALVAVQLVQQQKNQHHHAVVSSESNVIVGPGGLPGLITTTGLGTKVQVPVSIGDHHHITTMSPMSPVAGVSVDKPAMAAMVSSYIQAVEEENAVVVSSAHHLELHQGERIMKMYTPQPQHQEIRLPPLPPLKKVLSSQSMAIRNRYIRPHLQDVITRQEVLQQDTEELSSRVYQSQPEQTILVQETTGNIAVDDEILKEEYDVKSEGLEDDLADDSDEPLQDDDSDYEIENDLRPSRKSLPHKKRIPRKLKNLKKAASPSRSIHSKCYKCTKCGEQFSSQSAYSSHRLIHNNAKKMFNCELCGKGFGNQLKFFEHLKSHYEPTVNNTTAEINPIPKPTNNKEKLSPMKEESVVKDEREKQQQSITSLGALLPPLTCNQCGKTFRRQKAFETHVNLAHPKHEEIEEFSEPEDLMEGIRGVVDVGAVDTGDEADMDCLTSPVVRGLKNNSDKEWYREEDLHAAEADLQEMEEQHHQQQQQQHHHHHLHQQNLEEPDNMCELCGDVFENKELLEQHVRTDHLEFSPDPGGRDDLLLSPKRRLVAKRSRRAGLHLTCPQCGRMFNHRNSLVYHLRSHSGERPHQCEVCGKSFFAASALKVHMRLHSGDKPYKCEFCGRHFRQWGDLKYHCISIHSEEKNYQCEYCGKDFARKYSLIVHRRIHTGEKNYKCEFCGKSFRASSYLQNHRRIHTGEKPHPCEVCGKPFRVRSDMKRHLNTHNRDRVRGNSTYVHTSSSSSEMQQTLPQPKLEEHDSELDAEQLEAHGSLSTTTHTITVEHQGISALSSVAEITIEQEGAGGESILPDESLGEGGVDQQPINLNIAVPAVATRQSHHALAAAAQAVSEEVLHYARDPLETVKDGNNTLYVWPIYMT